MQIGDICHRHRAGTGEEHVGTLVSIQSAGNR